MALRGWSIHHSLEHGEGNSILVPSNGLTALQVRPDGKSHTQLWRDNKLGPGTGSPTISGDQFHVINKANAFLPARKSRLVKSFGECG